jgi:hypothetical protein
MIKEVKNGTIHYRFYPINDSVKKEAFIMGIELR